MSSFKKKALELLPEQLQQQPPPHVMGRGSRPDLMTSIKMQKHQGVLLSVTTQSSVQVAEDTFNRNTMDVSRRIREHNPEAPHLHTT